MNILGLLRSDFYFYFPSSKNSSIRNNALIINVAEMIYGGKFCLANALKWSFFNIPCNYCLITKTEGKLKNIC